MDKWLIIFAVACVALLYLLKNKLEKFSGFCPDPRLAPGSYAHPLDFSYANTRERPFRRFDNQPLADPQWAWQSPQSCPYIR